MNENITIKASKESYLLNALSFPQVTKTESSLSFCPVSAQTAEFPASDVKLCQIYSYYVTDYTFCYLHCVCLSVGYLVSTVLEAAGSNRQF